MRALVTGASGFVGSALCRALAREGHTAIALTRDPARARERIGVQVELVEGSIASPSEVAKAARACEVLFHAAGIAAVDAPLRVLRWVNVAGTENVVRAARHAGVKRVVHISCADVSLGEEDRMHWDEKRVLAGKPIGAHAQTKLMAEELALAESDETLEVTALRPALLWGPDDFDGLARLVRASRARTFSLYGGGRNIIATTHIDSLVAASLLAARAPLAAAHAYYIGDGEFLEAREFYGQLLAALGLPAPKLGGSLALALASAKVRALFRDDHGAERARLLALGRSALFDVSRATHDLGFEAKIDLTASFRELAAWAQGIGGADALLARARNAPTEADVEQQVRAAGGD